MTAPRRRKREDRPHQPGTLALKVPLEDYASLFAVGVFGALPVTTWLAMLLVPLGDGHRGGGSMKTVLGAILMLVTLFMSLVAPWLVPMLVLRARQPRGARIGWDDHGVSEWDGTWRRSTIAWGELQASHVTWETEAKRRTHVEEALQLVGPPPAPAISVWTSRPQGVPSFRRRLCAERDRVVELREALETRGIPMTRAPDWLLACDSDRPPHRTLTIIGRFGYPLATLAPIIAPSSPPLGVAMALMAAALLAARALPSLREVRSIMARARERAALDAGPPTAHGPAGYREAAARDPLDAQGEVATPASGLADDARALADRSKLRAVLIEAVVRVGCVVMVLASTAAALFVLH